MLIRAEHPSDDHAINDLTIRAFTGMPYSEGTEAPVIRLLRQSGELALSLVAEENGAIIGHVAFSPIRIDAHQNWFGLGPIAVKPSRQRAGIGKALIQHGLETRYVQRILFCGPDPAGELHYADAFDQAAD